ncbi:MAG: hypothetical protein KAX39_01465 [candidate division Zixibacteria bacterium]|nr:hypothetical protein [candidate division Zixibacteria bacterium]
MRITLCKTDLKSKSRMRKTLGEYIYLWKDISQSFNEDEIFSLILSVIRANEMNVVDIQKTKSRFRYNLDIEKVQFWIEKKLIPNTLKISVDDNELLKLLIFSLAMPYKMLKGETKATMTEKVRRGKERDFEQIFSDTFVGKIGEVAFKHFAKKKFNRNITLDWRIGKEIETFKSDIVSSKKIISIKSTDTLAAIWAEAPKNAHYGVLVKVSLPKDFFMKILAHISSLEKLLNFVKEKTQKDVTPSNTMELISFIKESAYNEMTVKAFNCGFFETSKSNFRLKGSQLNFLVGEFEIYEDKHLVKCNELKYSKQNWNKFFKEIF